MCLCRSTCKNLSIYESIAIVWLILTKLSVFSSSPQVKIKFWPFWKENQIFWFPCCSTSEELSIPESISTVGLILTKRSESAIEVVECFNMCKAAMGRRGLKVNNSKMKILVSGRECDSVVTLGNTPCAVCGRRVCCELGEMHWIH